MAFLAVLVVYADVSATLGVCDTIWKGGSADENTYFATIFACFPPTELLNANRRSLDSHYHDY